MDGREKDIFSIIEKLPSYSKLLFKLYRSKGISRRHKLTLSAGIAYSLSPIDIIPGIIPVAGQLDNLLVMLRCLEKVLDKTDPEITGPYLEEAGIKPEEIKEDIRLVKHTLKEIGRGMSRVLANTGKTAGYLAIYGVKKLLGKKPY
ncbi:MAG TPA: DUF1232 domain-containing protein [Clostridia bacterium]|nr:DUF1232 domain-containing protein [Clostridia bacterium]